MIYCMSDIHGAYDRYQRMLETIRFCGADTLYVIGDVIDRGPQGIDVVLDMMRRPNVILLRGNHEQMCLDDLHRHIGDARALWQKNGGSRTRSDLLYKRSPAVRSEVLRYFQCAPTSADIQAGGRKFHLVHGFPSEDAHDRLWGRPQPDAGRDRHRGPYTDVLSHRRRIRSSAHLARKRHHRHRLRLRRPLTAKPPCLYPAG